MSSPDAPDEKPLKGPERIAAYLKTLPDAPGVYRMLNAAGDVLYVGKAKSLKKRVASYARGGVHSERLTRMVAETAEMLFVTTASETEALLLESNLIKRCSAPCVNRIDLAGYHELVEEAESFLEGKSQVVQDELKAEMTKASEAMDFEAAAKLRDRLRAMSHIQSSQGVNPATFEE